MKIPIPKDVLCQTWLKLAQLFWRRSRKCEKFIDRKMDRQTTTTGDQKCSRELSAPRLAKRWRFDRNVAYKKSENP